MHPAVAVYLMVLPPIVTEWCVTTGGTSFFSVFLSSLGLSAAAGSGWDRRSRWASVGEARMVAATIVNSSFRMNRSLGRARPHGKDATGRPIRHATPHDHPPRQVPGAG